MDAREYNLKIYRHVVLENICTVFAAALCVGLVAIGTGSLHCLWGLLILLNCTSITREKETTT